MRKIKSINILKDPANMGGKDVFKASLFTGYELPKISIISKTNKRCLSVNEWLLFKV